jgi:hypothetical protein
MMDLLKPGWKRLLARLRRTGAAETTNYVIRLMRSSDYPRAYIYGLSYKLMKQNEFDHAGKLLKVGRKLSDPTRLIECRYASWLWCTGRRKAAIRLLTKDVNRSPRSYALFDLASYYDLSGNKRKSHELMDRARTLARQELKGRRR